MIDFGLAPFVSTITRDSRIEDAPVYWISPDGKIFANFEEQDKNEVMKGIPGNEWVRIRYYPGHKEYSVELHKLNSRNKNYLWAWAKLVIIVNRNRYYSHVKITEHGMDCHVHKFHLCDIAGEVFIPVNDRWFLNDHKPVLYPISSVSGFLLPRDDGLPDSVESVFCSGLSRLWGLMNGGVVRFVSAFREYRSLEQNIALNEELKRKIISKDIGLMPILFEVELEGNLKQVEKFFAVSRPELSETELTANIIELETSNPEYDQVSYLIVSNGVAQVVTGIGDKDHQRGTVIENPGKLKLSLLDEWMKSTLTWSCGDFYDSFGENPTFVKPGVISNLKKAKGRVFGDIGHIIR